MRNIKDFQARYDRWKNGERYWDIRGVELPKYDTGKYITVRRDDGFVYNVNPNVADSQEITVTTPEIEVVGKNPNFYGDSAFRPNEAINLLDKLAGNTIGKVMQPITKMPGAMPILRTLTPSNWVGTIRTGDALWSENNPGFGTSENDQALNSLFNWGVNIPIAGKAGKAFKKLGNNVLDYKALKTFNNRYGYNYNIKPTIVFDNNKLDKVYNHIIKQHNTFARGVDPYEAIKWGRFPKNSNIEEIARYSLTHIPKRTATNVGGLIADENALYTSNSIGLAQKYTNGNGYIGILERPTLPLNSFGSRRQALKAADFTFEPIPDNIYSSTTDFPKQYMYAKPASRYSKNAYNINGKWYKPLFDKVKSNQVVRGNAGTFPIRQTNMTDKNFRHYLFVGDVGEQPLQLKYMRPYKNKTSMSDFDYTSIGFTKKK